MKVVFAVCALLAFSAPVFAGSAFAEAQDKEGNASTWTFFTADKVSASTAANEAIKKLKEQGQTKVISPASTPLDHGVYVVVFAAYEYKGEARWRHGYGFHKSDKAEAEKAAVANLKKHDPNWKKDYGYDVKESKAF